MGDWARVFLSGPIWVLTCAHVLADDGDDIPDAVRDVTVDELAQQVQLVRFDRLSLLKVRDVLAAGMRLEPTGRNPRLYTVSFDDLEDGVQRLVSCPRRVMPNAYHDA